MYNMSFTYIFGNGAVRVERLAEEARARGRKVEYHNLGLVFENEREKRIPYFQDGAHLNDKGNDAVGKFYAERILASDAKAKPDKVQSTSPVGNGQAESR
jgi:hypothetical protein